MPKRTRRPVRAIALDVDGTLVGRDGIPASTWPAVDRVRREGIRLGLCTGRLNAGATHELAQRIDPHGLHVSQSGAVITGPSGRRVWSSSVHADDLRKLVTLSDQVGAVLEIYWQDGFGVSRPSEIVGLHAQHLGVKPVLLNPYNVRLDVTSAVWLMPHEAWVAAETCLATIQSLQVSPATTPWAPGWVFANITARGVSKGSALRRVAAHLGISIDAMAMVGDGENDRDALLAAGTAVVMVTAPEPIRMIADLVVPGVDDDGLVEALRHLVPGRTRERRYI